MATKKQTNRRQVVLTRLENQLVSGVKPEKINGKTTKNFIPLTPTDTKRIQKDIEILKSRV